jgi:hypothetical protein
MLQNYGFDYKGAKLVAGYCVVKRKIKKKDGTETYINTLQQGSPCSPIISNLVLNLILDEPIKAWIDGVELEDAARKQLINVADAIRTSLTVIKHGRNLTLLVAMY